MRTPNPQCPHCGAKTRKHGKTAQQTQRYCCAAPECRRTFTGTPRGKPLLFARPLTNTEKANRSRAKTGSDGNESRRRLRAEKAERDRAKEGKD